MRGRKSGITLTYRETAGKSKYFYGFILGKDAAISGMPKRQTPLAKPEHPCYRYSMNPANHGWNKASRIYRDSSKGINCTLTRIVSQKKGILETKQLAFVSQIKRIFETKQKTIQ